MNKSRMYRIEKFTEKQTEAVRVQFLLEYNYCESTIIVRNNCFCGKRNTRHGKANRSCESSIVAIAQLLLEYNYCESTIIARVQLLRVKTVFVERETPSRESNRRPSDNVIKCGRKGRDSSSLTTSCPPIGSHLPPGARSGKYYFF